MWANGPTSWSRRFFPPQRLASWYAVGPGEETTVTIPRALQEAIERGELSDEQLRELIAIEADALGLSVDEAIQLARERRLPRTYVGADLELLVRLLPA